MSQAIYDDTEEIRVARRDSLKKASREQSLPQTYFRATLVAFYVTAATVAQIANGMLLVYLINGA